MALVPCKVCGTLNSDEAEICLSCEFPVQGRKRPAIYQWAALGLFALFVAPLLAIALNWLSQRQQAQPTSAAPQTTLTAERLAADLGEKTIPDPPLLRL